MNFDRYNIRLSFLFFVICLAIAGCKKTKEDPYQNHMLAQETFDYGYFKTGTYWIYQDSITGAEDCVYVFYNYTQIDTIPENNYYEYDAGLYNWFDVKCHSRRYDQDFLYWCNSSWSSELNGFRNLLFRNTKGRETISWTNKYEIGKKIYPYNGVVTCMAIYNNYMTFKNVVEFNDSKNSTENDSPTNFYFAQNVGIVRKEILDSNQVWNLIKYNCIQ